MRIGAVYPQTEAGGDPRNVRAFGVAMESLGLDHLLVFDHVAGAKPRRRLVARQPVAFHRRHHSLAKIHRIGSGHARWPPPSSQFESDLS